MPSRSERFTNLAAAGLALLMAVTRFHHFGSGVSLPDASLAIFFLAGLFLSWFWFPAFLLLAGLIDYVAVTWGGVSAFCITPAYAFLIPTYGAMMLGGVWARRHVALGANDIPRLLIAAVLGTTAAFAISNGSFYLYSGYFADLSFGAYLAGTVKYYVPYLSYTLIYIAVCLAGIKLVRIARAMGAARA